MARGPCTFKETDVTRALRATVKAGLDVQRCEIDKDGKIVVVTGRRAEAIVDVEGVNEWDDI